MTAPLTPAEKTTLLQLARQAMEAAAGGRPAPPAPEDQLTPELRRPGASFVTLMRGGDLRGCIGALQARLPLYEDVQLHAAQAARDDYRFLPVTPDEVPELEVEVSVLSEPQPLAYDTAEALPGRLRPGVDGVILSQGLRRATFLPQVWEKVPEPELFLSMLCEKMGAAPDLWRRSRLDVQVYQVEEFREADF